jgi:histidinol-phosphatase
VQRLDEIVNFARELAAAAEREILPLYRRCAVDHKSDGSEVTDADRRAEAAMRALIARRFPSHAVLGEEQGGDQGPAPGPRWIIDPLDGTTSFAIGLPLFGTLVGYLEDGEPLVGVIHMPVLGETVYAARGSGCWYQAGTEPPAQVTVASPRPLAEALVSVTGVHASEIAAAEGGPPARYRLTPLARRARKIRFGGDCVQHALVCRGILHVAIDAIMKPWDIAAILPCIAEAGGVASTIAGARTDVTFGGSLVTSCDPRLHDEVLAAMEADRR